MSIQHYAKGLGQASFVVNVNFLGYFRDYLLYRPIFNAIFISKTSTIHQRVLLVLYLDI